MSHSGPCVARSVRWTCAPGRQRSYDAATDLRAFDIGKTQVEHDEIGRAFFEEAQRLPPGAGDIHLVAAAPQKRTQGALNRDLVVNEQNACRLRHTVRLSSDLAS